MAETDSSEPSDDGSEDYSHLFRSEVLVSDVDLRVDVAETFGRYVAGSERIEVEERRVFADASVTMTRGARTRHAGDYERHTGGHEMIGIGERYVETVHGSVHQKAPQSAEAMIGGAYANTIAGPYLRVAAWVDFLAWGGWAEVDVIRAELTQLMARSHIGYAHAAAIRATAASVLFDDFTARVENFAILSDKSGMYADLATPGGGITNEA